MDSELQFEERRVSDPKRERERERESKKKKEQMEKRTHCLGVSRKRVAHNIKIMRHGVLPRKAIRAVSIDHSREMWMVN